MTATISQFSPIEGGIAVVNNRGIFKELPLYVYSDRIYAKVRDGFVRLKASNLTSMPSMSWQSVHGASYVQAYDGLHIVPSAPTSETKLKVAK